VTYTIVNTYDYPLYFAISDANQHTVSMVYDEGIKVNYGSFTEKTVWQARDAGSVHASTIAPDFYADYPDFLNWFDVTQTREMAATLSAGTITHNKPADVLLPPAYVFSDAPTLPSTAWVQPIPLRPGDSCDWSTPPIGCGDLNFWYPTPYDVVNGVTYNPILNGNAAIGSLGPFFRERKEYIFASSPGFPRVDFTQGGDSKPFLTDSYTVQDQYGNPVDQAFTGWYLLQPGSTFVITKFVSTPTLLSYNDADMCNPASFSSYTTRRCDNNLSVAIDNSLSFSFAHVNSPLAISYATKATYVVGTSPYTYTITK